MFHAEGKSGMWTGYCKHLVLVEKHMAGGQMGEDTRVEWGPGRGNPSARKSD